MHKVVRLHTHAEAQALCGPHDGYLRRIERGLKVKLSLDGEQLKISGTSLNTKKAFQLFELILQGLRSGQGEIGLTDLERMIAAFKGRRPGPLPGAVKQVSLSGSRQIGPRTPGQSAYIEAIKRHDIVFGIGPAGTGKTYLAMATAVEELNRQQVRRIILTRPAIEAGESLGYLPGDMYEKISPYLRPLYDALYDMMDAERIEKYLENGIIEVAPLAYMRGRTLNDAFIILDEAQNCTAEQMKMFLTRLGFDSKAVITGDLTQSDLPEGKPIGLLQAQEILKEIEGIRFIYFSGEDVVRHALVQRVIEAYDKAAH
jgi:phosphate starvation-inducible PhoH-like protein